jgi:hypothetical protein
MPWAPELFSTPVLQQILDRRRRDALVAVPYCDGLLAGDPDPLVESSPVHPSCTTRSADGVKGEGLGCVDGSQVGGEGGSMKRTRRPEPPVKMPSGFTGFLSRPR